MSFGGLQKIQHDGIHRAEIPEGLVRGRRLQFGHGQLRIGVPCRIADIVGAQLLERGKRRVMDGRPAAQHGIHHHLQRGRRLQRLRLRPIHLQDNGLFRGAVLCKRTAGRHANQAKNRAPFPHCDPDPPASSARVPGSFPISSPPSKAQVRRATGGEGGALMLHECHRDGP